MFKCSNNECNFILRDRYVDMSPYIVKSKKCPICNSNLKYDNELKKLYEKYKKNNK